MFTAKIHPVKTRLKKALCLLATLSVLGTAGALPAAAAACQSGTLTMKDVLSARKYLAAIIQLPDLSVADCNADGIVDMKDILQMRQWLACGNCRQQPVVTAKTTVKPAAKPTTKPTVKPTTKPTAATPSTRFSAEQERILALVNAERKSAGLSALTLDETACTAATVRAREVATVFSHTRPNGSSCFTALKEAGVSYRAAGENIAKGYRSAESVMDGWMHSDGHRANILNKNFTRLGVGYDAASNSWTQFFVG